MTDTRDDEGPQKRDHWGGLLQNEYGRALGRIEAQLNDQTEKLQEMRADGRTRDKSLKDIEERVRGNAHKTNNDLQLLSSRVEGAQVTLNTAKNMVEQVSVQVAGLDKRVSSLEAPVNEAIATRNARRERWKRRLIWLSAAGVFLWGGFEPIYRTFMPLAIQRWFNLNLPH